MTRNRWRLLVLCGAAVAALVIPLTTTWYVVHQQVRQRVLTQAEDMAATTLLAAEMVSDQSLAATQVMIAQDLRNPCDASGLLRMRQELVRNKLLQDIGYVRGDWLHCSALVQTAYYLGPFDYHSALGNEVRAHLGHPLAPDVRSMALTQESSGFTVFIRPDLLLDRFPREPATVLALLNVSSLKLIVAQGEVPEDLVRTIGRLPKTYVAVRGDVVLAWRASARYDVGAVAILPADSIERDFRQAMAWMLPMTLGVCAVLLMVLFWLGSNDVSLLAEFRRALRRDDEFFLVYQPIVDLSCGDWVGVEALLRWRRQSGEQVSPDVFIPLAERRGLMPLVTAKVLALLQRDLPALLKRHPTLQLAVNLCPQDLADPDIVPRLAALVRALGVPASHVHVEITERVAVDIERAVVNIRRLRELGVRVSLDDFGTGYSSLSYLADLELDQLKIDRCFVGAIGRELVTSHVVEHIIDLGRSMRLDLVAEGVETPQQADFLRERGVPYAQGWYFAKPMPVDALAGRLANSLGAQAAGAG